MCAGICFALWWCIGADFILTNVRFNKIFRTSSRFHCSGIRLYIRDDACRFRKGFIRARLDEVYVASLGGHTGRSSILSVFPIPLVIIMKVQAGQRNIFKVGHGLEM